MTFVERDERAHGAAVEEWTFSCWAEDGSLGLTTGLRLIGAGTAWYWWGLAIAGESLLHVMETDIPRRSNPLLAKAAAMWAEFTCESPFEQWTVGNETYAVELDDPADGLGRAYGNPVPIASDLEWYATGEPIAVTEGYRQSGVVHGAIELTRGQLDLGELPGDRTHRWGPAAHGWRPPRVRAHLGPRAAFVFPDGTNLDMVLTPQGWRSRD